MSNMIQKAAQATPATQPATQNVNTMLSALIDGNKMRQRFNDLLGKRAPQFISSLVTLVNGDENLMQVMRESPMTIVQSGLKAASYDLPIDPSLGYAYIVPFNNKQKDGSYRKEAAFVLGYRGMVQLALRTGAYSRVPDAIDVREGELIKYDRLTGDAEFRWIEDEEAREKLPVIGYAGYFRLKNGAEKTIYMTKSQVDAHEKKNRKGQYMGKGWRDDWDAMAKKTVLRRLISHYGLMSIEYQTGDEGTVALAQAIMEEGDNVPMELPAVNTDTGEVIDVEPKPEA